VLLSESSLSVKFLRIYILWFLNLSLYLCIRNVDCQIHMLPIEGKSLLKRIISIFSLFYNQEFKSEFNISRHRVFIFPHLVPPPLNLVQPTPHLMP
jgi:hypothetical protein